MTDPIKRSLWGALIQGSRAADSRTQYLLYWIYSIDIAGGGGGGGGGGGMGVVVKHTVCSFENAQGFIMHCFNLFVSLYIIIHVDSHDVPNHTILILKYDNNMYIDLLCFVCCGHIIFPSGFTWYIYLYFTGLFHWHGAIIIWLPQCQWSNPEGYG